MACHLLVQADVPTVIALGFDSKMMQLLLDRDGEIQITEGVIIAAAGNENIEEDVMQLLLKQVDEMQITERVIEVIAAKFDSEMMQLLLERSGEIQITEGIVIAAAGNQNSGRDVMRSLLRQSDEMQIAEDTIKAIPARFDSEIIQLLLERDEGIQITEKVLMDAARN